MLLAIAVILGTISLGAALAFLPGLGPRALGVVRSFALAAAISVVFFHLLPDAIEALGARALVALGAGMLLPAAIERGLGRRPRGAELAFEVGFVGLLAHAFGDGVAFWAFQHGSDNVGAMLALGAHTVPVTAVVVLRVAESRGVGSAIVRAAVLALTTLAGMGAGEVVPMEAVGAVLPWLTAVASGLLLHVVAHEVAGPRPSGPLDRTLELGAALVGAALAFAGAHGPEVVGGFARALADVTRAVALPVLVGFAVASWIERRAGAEGAPDFERAGAWTSVGLGLAALVGVVFPAVPLEPLASALSLALLVWLGRGSALGAAPLAVVLASRMSPAWVFGALMLGPLMNARASRPGVGKLGLWAEIGAAVAAMALAHSLTPPLGAASVSAVAGIGLAMLLAAGLWYSGLRGWLARLGVHSGEG